MMEGPYINEPKTVEDIMHNVEFQAQNCRGYINMKAYESAFVKAVYLKDEVELLIKSLSLLDPQQK